MPTTTKTAPRTPNTAGASGGRRRSKRAAAEVVEPTSPSADQSPAEQPTSEQPAAAPSAPLTSAPDAPAFGDDPAVEDSETGDPADSATAGWTATDVQLLSVAELLAHPDNLREEAKPNPGLVATLKTHGLEAVVYPIIVVAHPEGTGYLIIDGHERVLSFQDAVKTRPELTEIPALIRPDLAGRAEQIVTMLRTAVHRRQLTSIEQARGVQQLALFGMSKAKIVKETGFKRGQVDDALAIADMDADIRTKVTQYGLNLHQAAVVQDFADNTDTVAILLKAAESGPIAFDKKAVEQRNERTEQQQRTDRIQELTGAGITVIDENDLYRHHPGRKKLTDLKHNGEPVTPDNHAQCPGHAIVFERTYNGIHETAYCTDYRQYQHTDRYGSSSSPVTGPMTEKQKEERRTVIANNKAMEAANEVRRTWLKTLFARKSIKGAARYVAETMLSRPHFVSRWVQKSDAAVLDSFLGTKSGRPHGGNVPPSANDARCIVYLLATIAAAHENEISRETWRHNDETTAGWFEFLRTVGYDLDDVEQLLIDRVKPRASAHAEGTPDTVGDSPASEPVGADDADQGDLRTDEQDPQEPDSHEPPKASTEPTPAADAGHGADQPPRDTEDEDSVETLAALDDAVPDDAVALADEYATA